MRPTSEPPTRRTLTIGFGTGASIVAGDGVDPKQRAEVEAVLRDAKAEGGQVIMVDAPAKAAN